MQSAEEQVDHIIKRMIEDKIKSVPKQRGNLKLHRYMTDQVERVLLEILMEMTGYNQSNTAKFLGLSRSTLRLKLERHFGRRFFPQVAETD